MSHSPISTTQIFSRRALATLLDHRDKLPVDDVGRLLAIKTARKRGTALVGEIDITYTFSRKKAGNLGYGRLYGQKYSFEWLPSEIRGSLCGEYYHDLDIVNAQPTILLQMARREGVDLPQLEHYVENRDAVLSGIHPDRNTAKELMLVAMFDAKPPRPTLAAFNEEMRSIAKHFSRKPEHAELWEACQKEDSKYSSFLSHLVQSEERKCMLAMREFMMSAGWSVDVLPFDGIMVRKRGDAVLTEEVLRCIEEAVRVTTGYALQIKEKPLVGFDLPTVTSDDDAEYTAMRTEFEANHFYFKPSNTVVEVTPKGLCHYKLDHAMMAFNMWLLSKKDSHGEPELFLKRWLRDPKRRIVTDLVMKMPDDCDAHEASLFAGFAYKLLDDEPSEEDVALFMDLLSSLCNDEAEVRDYVLKTLAHMIQKPLQKNGVCIIFSSMVQGTGKDTVMSLFERLIGASHSAHYTSEDDFWSPYDTKKEGAIFMYMEEAGAGANKVHSNHLKARITADTITINPKGVSSYSVPNVARYFMTTNEADPVKIEATDRRFLIINPSTRLHAANWEAITEQFHTNRMMVSVGRFLETVDITGWNPRKFPVTEVKAELEALSKSPELLFMEQWAAAETSVEMLGRDLFIEYRGWCQENSVPPLQSALSFLKRILCIKGKHYTTRKGHGNITTFIPLRPSSPTS